MKKIYLLVLTCCAAFVGGISDVSASHLLGAEITYTCTNSCTYRIFHRSYYDCGGNAMVGGGFVPINPVVPNPPGSPQVLSITGVPLLPGQMCSDPTPVGNWTLDSYVEVTQLCPGGVSNCENLTSSIYGVSAATWYRDYDFCATNCDQYDISWSSCCRNYAITSTSSSDGMYLGGISIYPDTVCNESPSFTEDPAVVICQNTSTAFSQGAIDAEGDSLVYSLTQCLSNPSPISYLPGYGAQTPLGPHWSVNVNPSSGWLTFVPDSIAGLEVGVLCIQVDEYRNGALIGSIIRDIQVTVIPCDTTQLPMVGGITVVNGGQAISSDTLIACPGTPISFEVIATDPDTNDVLTLVHTINQILPSASISISGTNPAVLTTTWTPMISDVNQVFEILVGAYDETCPYPLYAMASNFISVSDSCLGALITDTQCNDSTGAIDLTVGGGVPPYSFLWNTGDMTEDLSNLVPGSYWVDVMDGGGALIFRDTFYVDANEILLNPDFTLPDCIGNGGEIELMPSGGMMPYSYQWSTGSQSNVITGLSPGGYSIIVEDANACPKQEVFFLSSPDSCFVQISGKAFYDLNLNCVQDVGESGIPYLFIELTPGSATFTDVNGTYTMFVDTGNYVLEAQPAIGTNLIPFCPGTGQHTLNLPTYDSDTTGIDFAMELIPVQDLRVSGGFVGWKNSGFPYEYLLQAYNDGNVLLTDSLTFRLDPQMSYDSTSLTSGTYDPLLHTLTWALGGIPVGQSISLSVFGKIDSTATIGDSLRTIASLMPISGDINPLNNVLLDSTSTVGSYDPNDKQVSPAGLGTAGFIQASENEMNYTIRFQNTGNFSAQFVVIRDTIDSDLDVSSYRPLAQSHVYSLDVEEDSILVFTFSNIQLPDSMSDPAGSQGMVSFSLRHEGTLAVGTEIRNSAAIYFDFNSPIITNEVLNIIYSSMALNFETDSILCGGELIKGLLVEQGLAPFHYQWSTGDQLTTNDSLSAITINTGGLYTLTVTDALGISVEDSIHIEILPSPTAIATTDIQGLQVQFGDSSLYVVDRWWNMGDGTILTDPNPVYTYAQAGNYLAKLIVDNACGTDVMDIPIFLTTSIEEDFHRKVEVLPNPFSLQTRIRFPNPNQQAYQMQLMDTRGRILKQWTDVRSEEILVSRENMSAGIYLIHLSGGGHRYIGKLMVE